MNSTLPQHPSQLLKATMAIAATMAVSATFAPLASADACAGLDCPDAQITTVTARGPVAMLTPAEVESNKTISGFYDIGTKGEAGTRQVAYIAAPGEWNAAPAEIRSTFSSGLSAADRAVRKVVVFGPGAVASFEAPAFFAGDRGRNGGTDGLQRLSQWLVLRVGWRQRYG